MRDIFMIMEHTCEGSVKKLCLTYVVLLLAQCILGFLQEKVFSNLIIVYAIPVLVAFIIINRIHVKRINFLLKEGALNRIILLPVKRYAFLWSELLFTGVSYGMILFIQQLVALILYLIFQHDFHGLISPFFFYAISNHATLFFTPYALPQLFMLAIVLCSITILFTYMHVSIAIASNNCFLSVMLVFVAGFTVVMMVYLPIWIILLIYVFIGLFSFRQLYQAIRVRRYPT